MSRTLLLVILSVIFSGCGVNVKRTLNNNVLVSSGSPAVRLNIPQTFKLTDSASGKEFAEYQNKFGGSQNDREWFSFFEQNKQPKPHRMLFVEFREAGVNSHFLENVKNKTLFSHGNAYVKGLNMKTAFKVENKFDQKRNMKICFITKIYRKVLPPKQRRSFVIIYGEHLPCNKVMQARNNSALIAEVNGRADALINQL
ncbi:hypothetical protein [Zooshikella harenae]|uniref:Lipoprotein n=1 Tax=Zooshikella harenae TaxID=2827238 RepID=A0ABS5ZIS1_9GAMM|nr:hypothetical protein [Zooshikella harenae]MBU2713974.1 hypothetical protein [Zooshikella harenae]